MSTRAGPINVPITLGVRFYENGVLYDPFSVGPVRIYTYPAQDLIATLTPDAYGTGIYRVIWDALATDPLLEPGVYIDEWTWTAQSGMPSKSQKYLFELTEATVTPTPGPTPTPDEPLAVGCRDKPSWVTRPGLRRVDDLGNGMGIALAWQEARTADYTQQIHYNIYAADTRFDLLNNDPIGITTAQSVVVNITPGNTYHFAVRAAEFATDIDITELVQIGVDLYQYPDAVTLANNLDDTEDGYTILVDGDISGYPSTGELLIDTELIRYTSIDTLNNGFVVAINDRAIVETNLQEHAIGADVKLWHGIEDGNTIIRQGTAGWHEVIPQSNDAIGEYNADADGYRAVNEDILTTDLSAADEDNSDFPHYDFKGYHRPSLQRTLSGQCVGSYTGGEFNGLRGLNLQERTLAREDTLLQTTGEPVVFLRRKWSGRRCKCMGMRREHQRTRCDRCFGVGFEGGYDRFFNSRAVSELFTNSAGYIMIRVNPHTDDLDLKVDQGLFQDVMPNAWTLPFPTLKDRDIIVRFSQDFIEEFRYEILDVTRNKLLFNLQGQQTFKMRRLDKTDVVMQYDIDDTTTFFTIP